MSELYREIEQEMKRERYEKLWRSVGKVTVYGSIAVIILTALYVAWDSYQNEQAEEKTSQLLAGIEKMNSGDYKGAVSAFSEISVDPSSPYYAIAMLQKANAQELSGDVEGSKKTYEIVSHESNVFGELARLREDAKDARVFKQSAQEKAAWNALAANKKGEAGKIFLEISRDADSPDSMAARATEMVRMVAPEKLTEQKVVK